MLALFVEQKSMKLQPVCISIDNNYMIHNTPHVPVRPSQWDPSQWGKSERFLIVEQLQNTLPLICMSLNKNSIYCVMLRSSKNADQRKQWWYRVAGYSAVAPPLQIA